MELRSGVKIPKDYNIDYNIKKKAKKSYLTAKELIYNNMIKNTTNLASLALLLFVFIYYITIAFKQ